jgi:hypothetical protein
MDPIERFNRSYIVLPNGCWEWKLSRNIKDGYAQFSTSRTSTARAARWAWKTFVGPIPSGQTIEHTCHTRDLECKGGPSCPHRACVNWVDCLALLDRRSNTLLSRKIQDQLNRTHCPAGHEYSPENTWVYSRMRSCKTCNYARSLGVDPKIIPILTYGEVKALVG